MVDIDRLLLTVEQSAIKAAKVDITDVWPTRIIGVGELDNIQWYALTTTGVKSPLFATHAEATEWAVEYNKGHDWSAV